MSDVNTLEQEVVEVVAKTKRVSIKNKAEKLEKVTTYLENGYTPDDVRELFNAFESEEAIELLLDEAQLEINKPKPVEYRLNSLEQKYATLNEKVSDLAENIQILDERLTENLTTIHDALKEVIESNKGG